MKATDEEGKRCVEGYRIQTQTCTGDAIHETMGYQTRTIHELCGEELQHHVVYLLDRKWMLWPLQLPTTVLQARTTTYHRRAGLKTLQVSEDNRKVCGPGERHSPGRTSHHTHSILLVRHHPRFAQCDHPDPPGNSDSSTACQRNPDELETPIDDL